MADLPESSLHSLLDPKLITLSNEDRDFFLSMLDDDSPPSAKSLAAVQYYKEGVAIKEMNI